MRIGTGYDIHSIIPTIRKSEIPIGGIAVPCYYRVDSHSDGDALLHAITDACFGALALGDIGQWFPDSAPENLGRTSSHFLTVAISEIKKLGWEVQNVDCTVHLEEPKLAPLVDSMRQHIAQLMGCELRDVSVKCKSGEGMGAVGEKRAIEANAVVLLRTKS